MKLAEDNFFSTNETCECQDRLSSNITPKNLEVLARLIFLPSKNKSRLSNSRLLWLKTIKLLLETFSESLFEANQSDNSNSSSFNRKNKVGRSFEENTM